MRIIRTKADGCFPSAFKIWVAVSKEKGFSETEEIIAVTQQSKVRNLGKHVVIPKSSNLCKMYRKKPKTSQKWLVFGCFWSKWRDSNSRPPVPETGALPTALHLEMVKNIEFSVSGQTCGQTEDLRNFRQSGVPKKSVFSRGFSVFQNFIFEIGGLHPKLARYQLRYTSNYLIWEHSG